MKETKPYDLSKEGPKNIVSEPMAEYQSMSSLQLEADKARLIRAIVNIDSKLVFDKVKQRLGDILNLREEVPAFGASSYLGQDGKFHEYGAGGQEENYLNLDDSVNYNKIFDRKNRINDLFFLDSKE